MRRLEWTLVTLCTLVATAGAEEATPLTWKVKAGDTASYRFEARNVDGEVPWTISIAWKSKVLEVAADGKIKVQGSQSDLKLIVAGQDISDSVGDASKTTEKTHHSNGLLVQRPSGEDARVDAALQFVYPDRPVKTGDTWKQTFTADAARGLRASEATYRYEGVETVGKWKAHKVAVTYRETEGEQPMSLRGHEWLSVEDGVSIQVRYNVRNAPFTPGQPPEPEAEITTTRLD